MAVMCALGERGVGDDLMIFDQYDASYFMTCRLYFTVLAYYSLCSLYLPAHTSRDALPGHELRVACAGL